MLRGETGGVHRRGRRRVVSVVRVTGRSESRRCEIDVDMGLADRHRRDGKVIRVEASRTRAQALEAVGLRE